MTLDGLGFPFGIALARSALRKKPPLALLDKGGDVLTSQKRKKPPDEGGFYLE
ncbi:hypothetical protein [Aliiglaciecola sp. M165]|uniref:hypothetical protein n=1 Tax=Aliiglaciecola sp. M165 TaxID=2593649 RepID=UPI00163D7148|nr:hypothetical protein [Aliiglaciecola sp. M165]